MSALVLIVPGSGPNYPDTQQKAEELYSEMISRTQSDRIIALREDSTSETPPGLREFAAKMGTPIQTHTIERIDPSSFTGQEDPEYLWADHLSTIISRLGLGINESDTNFVIGPGSGWNSSLLLSLQEVIGGKIWVSRSNWNGETNLSEIETEILEEPALSTIAASGRISLTVGDQPFTSEQLQGLVEGMPANQGVENTFRPYPELISRHDEPGDDATFFQLTPLGRVRSMLALAQKWEPTKVKSGRKGLILAARDSDGAKRAIEAVDYLKEHFSALKFDAFMVVINKYGSTDQELSQSSEAVNQKLADFLKPGSLVSTTSSFVNGDQDTFSSHYELLSLIHRTREENDDIEWSLEVSRFLAPLRSAAMLYANHANLESFCLMKNPSITENGVFPSHLEGSMHRLNLPTKSQIMRIRGILQTESIHKHVFTAEMALSHPENPGAILSSAKTNPLRMYEWNRDNLPEGHQMRWGEISPDSQKQEMNKKRNIGIERGAFRESKDEFILTPEGRVAAFVLAAQMGDSN